MKINKIYLIILILIFISGCTYSARPPISDNTYQEQEIGSDVAEYADVGGLPEVANAEITSASQDSGGLLNVVNAQVSSREDYNPGGPAAVANLPGTLFVDRFEIFDEDKWEYRFNAPEVDTSVGNSAPSLKLPARGKIQTSSSGLGKSSDVLITTAVEPFTITNGLSISFDVKLPEIPSGSQDYFLGGLLFNLRKQDEDYPNAILGIASNSLSYLTRMSKSSYSDNRYKSAKGVAIRDTKWHNFELSIDSNGVAYWKKDGVTKLTGYIEPGDYVFEIRASPVTFFEIDAAGQYNYLIDNVVIRSLDQNPQTALESQKTYTQGTTTTTNPCKVYGNYYWSNGYCCPASTPYYCSATDKCYGTTSLAMSESQGQCVNFKVVR